MQSFEHGQNAAAAFQKYIRENRYFETNTRNTNSKCKRKREKNVRNIRKVSKEPRGVRWVVLYRIRFDLCLLRSGRNYETEKRRAENGYVRRRFLLFLLLPKPKYRRGKWWEILGFFARKCEMNQCTTGTDQVFCLV